MILHDLLSYEFLRVVWWGLLGVLLIGFALTDGFDMGVGALLPFVGQSDTERRIAINTVGPVWEGNQVWFILGGGAIFAAWPFVYAVMIGLVIVLWFKSDGQLLNHAATIFANPEGPWGTEFAGFIAIVGTMIAYFAAVMINFSDFSRYAKNKDAMVKGNLTGLPLNMILFSALALLTTAGAAAVYGEQIINPTEIAASVRKYAVSGGPRPMIGRESWDSSTTGAGRAGDQSRPNRPGPCSSINSSILPPPRATQVSGSSATTTGRPVFFSTSASPVLPPVVGEWIVLGHCCTLAGRERVGAGAQIRPFQSSQSDSYCSTITRSQRGARNPIKK